MHGKVVALVAAAVGFAACGPAWAGWPDDKPIEVVIGFAPGGGTDVMARKLLPFVEQRLGGKAKFVVLNKPGAGGEIAFAAIARAAPDAYAIGVVNVPGYNFIPMTRKTQYSMDEIRLIARVVDDPSVIVVPAESKLTNLADVLAALRSKPGSVTFGHNGAGTNGHLAIRMLAGAGKVEPNEISYRGTAAQGPIFWAAIWRLEWSASAKFLSCTAPTRDHSAPLPSCRSSVLRHCPTFRRRRKQASPSR